MDICGGLLPSSSPFAVAVAALMRLYDLTFFGIDADTGARRKFVSCATCRGISDMLARMPLIGIVEYT